MSAFGGMIVVDDFANFLSMLLLVSGLASIALSYDYIKRMSIGHSEYYVLLMFSLAGMILMSMAADLIVVFWRWNSPIRYMCWRDCCTACLEDSHQTFASFSSGFCIRYPLLYGVTGSTACRVGSHQPVPKVRYCCWLAQVDLVDYQSAVVPSM
jgi:hypothetical protein